MESNEDHRKEGAPMLYREEISDGTGPETPKGGGGREWYSGGDGGSGNREDFDAAAIENEDDDTRSLHGEESIGVVEASSGVTGVLSVVDMAAKTSMAKRVATVTMKQRKERETLITWEGWKEKN